MREKNKIEKYLDRLIKKHNGILVESEKSRYYSVSGNVSILLDNSDQGHYIIHGHTSGNISVLSYEQTKEFVRSFVQCSFIYADIGIAKPIPEIVPNGMFTQEVANYLKITFSKNQLQQMVGFLKGEGKKRHKQYLELMAII